MSRMTTETRELLQGAGEWRVGIVGLGNIGGALLKGLLNAEFDEEIIVSHRTAEETEGKLALLRLEKEKVVVTQNNLELVANCDQVFVALKQVQMKAELERWREEGVLKPDQLVVSFAAGVRVSTIKKWLGNSRQPVARVMPNTPVAVGRGVFGWTVSDEVTVRQARKLKYTLGLLGTEVLVEGDLGVDLVTAISGSGPAYFYRVAEVMVKWARERGIDQQVASKLVGETLVGAGLLLDSGNRSVEELRTAVTSRGGTTEAAIKYFSEHDLESVIKGGMTEAFERAGALGNSFDSL